MLLFCGLAAVGLVVVAAIGARTSLRAPKAVAGGGQAVGFTLENLRPGGPAVSLDDYRGRPVVLNFFASWCVPCRREMPGFEAVHDRVGDRVAFLGVDHQDQRGPALDLVEETGVSYPSGFDPRGTVAAANGLYGMPTTIFISPTGEVLERRTGEISERELEATIDRLFESWTRAAGPASTPLMAAQLGLEATGVDLAAAAIHTAEGKARDRELTVRFLRWDVLDLNWLGERFDTVLDCGLFHA